MNINKIIKQAGEMKNMLNSAYSYNSIFVKNEKDKELLKRILKAMVKVDRKYFVSKNYYIDTALPIGKGQTISQPSTVARMLFLLKIKKQNKILEIGTGSGWNTCLLAFLSEKVVSLEIIEDLLENAEKNIEKLKKKLREEDRKKLGEIELINKNILKDYEKWQEKYDKIIITAGISEKQEEKIKELAEKLLKNKGRLICPYREGPVIIFDKNKKLEKKLTREDYIFVPLAE